MTKHNYMERNKMIGLIISLAIAFSSVALFVYAPSAPHPVKPGTYSGKGFAVIRQFLDERWALVSPQDVNGLAVVGENPPYVFISPGDVNKTAQILSERGIVWYRDAILELNGIVIDGRRMDLNVYGYVFPTHSVGDTVPVAWQVTVNPDGTYNGYAEEILVGGGAK